MVKHNIVGAYGYVVFGREPDIQLIREVTIAGFELYKCKHRSEGVRYACVHPSWMWVYADNMIELFCKRHVGQPVGDIIIADKCYNGTDVNYLDTLEVLECMVQLDKAEA